MSAWLSVKPLQPSRFEREEEEEEEEREARAEAGRGCDSVISVPLAWM